jgi:hypothetical protein
MTTKRLAGPTPRGGAYSVIHFMDIDHNDAEEKDATHVEIVEYDKDGEQLWRTYGEIKPKEGAGGQSNR